MTLYSVTYSNPAALYLPKMNMLIECSKDEIWTLATALGLVQKIFDCTWGGPVYSVHWTHNHLGLSADQVMKNLEF
jgi:hypothetical protein